VQDTTITLVDAAARWHATSHRQKQCNICKLRENVIEPNILHPNNQDMNPVNRVVEEALQRRWLIAAGV